MRYILGFFAVLAVANLTGMVEMASAYQAPAAERTVPPPPPPAPSAAATVENALQGNAVPGAATTTTPGATVTSPANSAINQVPGTAGTVTTPAPGTTVTAPANSIQAGGVPGTVTSPAPGTTTAPGTIVPGTVNAGTTPNRAYSSYYVPGTQPGTTVAAPSVTTPGYYAAGVRPGTTYYTTPMGNAMAPGYYYPGTVAGPVGMGRNTTYSSMYVTPGYAAPAQTYVPAQRRGLFGGLFRRRYN